VTTQLLLWLFKGECVKKKWPVLGTAQFYLQLGYGVLAALTVLRPERFLEGCHMVAWTFP
jgi:hypothetical protein